MERTYRRASKAYVKLLEYLKDHQRDEPTLPSFRAIGRATGISHTQVVRLIRKAEAAGMLRRLNPEDLRYEVILSPPTPHGLVWVPRIEGTWYQALHWVRDKADGVWLDQEMFKLTSSDATWAVSFPELETRAHGESLRLNEHSTILVRTRRPDEMRTNFYYLILYRGINRILRIAERTPRRVSIRLAKDEFEHFKLKKIAYVAEVLMVVNRPLVPKTWR